MLIGVPLETWPARHLFDKDNLNRLSSAGLASFALEAAPHMTQAQGMDVRSSGSNITGGQTVMMAADKYQRLFPMLIAAAGGVASAPNT